MVQNEEKVAWTRCGGGDWQVQTAVPIVFACGFGQSWRSDQGNSRSSQEEGGRSLSGGIGTWRSSEFHRAFQCRRAGVLLRIGVNVGLGLGCLFFSSGVGSTSGSAQRLLPAWCVRAAPGSAQWTTWYWGLSPGLLHAKHMVHLRHPRPLGWAVEFSGILSSSKLFPSEGTWRKVA